jgi:hypothetical protein
MRDKLLNIFEKYNYLNLYKNNQTETVEIESYDDRKIFITFPGYKAKIEGNEVKIFDYRVDIQKGDVYTSLSHVNLIVDLYLKVKLSEGKLYEDIKNLLYNLSLNDSKDPLRNTQFLRSYKPRQNNNYNKFLEFIEGVHQKMNKTYNKIGNMWDYSINDLIYSIRWIVLQEDINYPISKGKQGRKMPFKRYYEAVYTAVNDEKSLEEVIRRALQKGYPPMDWKSFDYSLIKDIK